MTPDSAILGLVAALVVGVSAAFFPARQAARLEVVEVELADADGTRVDASAATDVVLEGALVDTVTGTSTPIEFGDIVASMFMHAGLLHLIGNLLFFWVTGPALEDVWGRPTFLGLFVIGGVVAV